MAEPIGRIKDISGGAAVAAAPSAGAPRRHRRSVLQRQQARSGFGFLSVNLAGFILFTLIPVGFSLYLAFFDWPLTGQNITFIGIKNFTEAFGSFGFWRVVLNVIYFVVVYVPINLAITLVLAALLGPRTSLVKGKSALRVMFFLPVVTPMVASSLVWSLMYDQNGIINNALGVLHIGPIGWLSTTTWAMPSIIIMSIWLGFGYNMILFVAGVGNIPDSLYEAAAIDGASTMRQFFVVTLPMLSPVVFFGAMMTLITSFQVFTQAYVLTKGGPGNASTTLVLDLYQEGFQYFRLGYASAIAWLLFILILITTGIFYATRHRWVYEESGGR